MFKVLHVIDEFGFGGKWNGIAALGRGMDTPKFKSLVTVPELDSVPAEADDGKFDRVEWKIRNKWDITAIFRLAGLVKNNNVHIIHSHGRRADMAAAAVKFMTRKTALVTTLHEPMNRDLDWNPRYDLYARIYAKLLKFSFDRVLAVSRDAADDACRSYGLPQNKVVAFHNGIETGRFDPALRRDSPDRNETRQRFALSESDIVVVFAGQMAPRKAPELLLRAAKPLIKQYPELRIVFAGDGPLIEPMKKLAAEWGMDKATRFPGRVPDIERLFLASDIFALPSRMEGMPRALLEGMAAGLPAIATRVGGAPEVIEHEKTGLLIDPGDTMALTNSIRRLIEDKALRASIIAHGRHFVMANHSIEIMARETEDQYMAVLKDKGLC